ncbi:HAD family phosphatase [Flavobacterium antarcticum]|uniref:HAD family hydrolase n=1 Tax=Flavobacterium antarcticum TaxID=271155 RepID=UPI0003B30FD6|nr:HAD family phosphatase [Flavobacterium antarcticum]
MIKNIIFDFGDVFIDLDKEGLRHSLQSLGIKEWNSELNTLNESFEKGRCSEEFFLSEIQKHSSNKNLEEIKSSWCTILGDFPLHRLEFLEQLVTKNYRLFLLSNTDAIHIAHFQKKVGSDFYNRFYNCFEKVYFSFEMGLRKPQTEIYTQVLSENNLISSETLFVDDKKENTDAAEDLGIQVWTLKVGEEDVIELFDKVKF